MGMSEAVMLDMIGHMVVFWYGSRNADGSRILQFADGLNLVICNTLFTKQEAKLVTYVAGPVKSTVDYIMVQQEDKPRFVMSRLLQVRNVFQNINC